ncbi:Rrf2 family transcriptional regulator [Undibacterium sp.]|jgi:Rrf2 family nitric oxide-sensitive transcriptional repressor|uniref:RrF2 family transcriptional regulator n=1 Tax=Undibacterium sp. TaxID=1914977 RepID=UPI002C4D0F37|nr:Rrf2 family transcriptional regulator [Undibacterium sp.]HTD04361.1 Rrf2 family transcriptional regulator [Undibacterium sp.]
MRLTRYSDIGLRVLMYLARESRTPAVTVGEVSGQFDIPHNHLVKVVGAMAKLGWIDALRGRNGGISLAVPAKSLRIGDVLQALEGSGEAIDCDGLGCQLAADCGLRHALRSGMQAFYAAMNRYTLADIASGGTGEQIVRMHRSFLGRSVQV